MSQPIKNSANAQNYFSKELTNILGMTTEILLKEYPVREITPEYFLLGTLADKDTMLYKTISGFLTFTSISKIYDKIMVKVQDSLVTVIKPGIQPKMSAELNSLLSKSYDVMKETNNELITSDIVLLTMLKHNESISELFREQGLTYDIALNESVKLHDTLKTIETSKPINIEPIQEIRINVSGGNGNNGDMTNIANNVLNEIIGVNRKKNNIINAYCTNLNEMAAKGKIDDLIGMDDEINTITNIINRRKSNNVVIVGEPGVGKTQLVNGLAKKIVDGTCPPSLLNTTIYRLNITEMMAGTNLRGMFEERVLSVIKELSAKKNVILFIDNFHNFVSKNKKDDYDISSLMDNVFTNGDIKVIITTSVYGYKVLCDDNDALSRKFQKLTLTQPKTKNCMQILEGLKKTYEKFHKVRYTDEAIEACVKLSERYMPERSLPSSAIDILDESGASKKLEAYENVEIRNLITTINTLEKEKDREIKNDNISKANDIGKEITENKTKLAVLYDKIENNKVAKEVNEKDIYETISKHTGIDINKMSNSELESLSHMADNMKKNIIGQDHAIDIITKAVKRSKVGLFPQNRPILSCMCIGSTGVGKTLMAKMLAKEVFGSEKNMLRFDMSEYSDKTSVNKLIGSSAGYVGYEKGGMLTEAVRNKKHTVLLIDELEKADEEVYNLFLQILDEGYLTDNIGNKVDFKNTIILITSNVGAKRASNEKALGFNPDENLNKKSIIEKELKKKFPPEFINRLDEIVYFNNLEEDSLKKIIELELSKLEKRMEDIGHSFSYEDDVVSYIYNIIEKEKENGARPILRAIQNEIENKITDSIIENSIGNNFKISVKDNEIWVANN